jgi:hypothetical protein
MIGKLMFSKVSRSVFVVAAIATGMTGLQSASAERVAPARLGSSSYHSDAGCWLAYGPAMTNALCGTAKNWYVPLLDVDGNTRSVTVTAQGASVASNVTCRTYSWMSGGQWFFGSAPASLPFFGPVAGIQLDLFVPQYFGWPGSADIDCLVHPGGQVISAVW